ncbi:MAG: preprotein translocase subunit SecA [Planctomycetes bacterium]|jgi:preprotein translocase subunit SecA|nr:preprotein translocase subunit SecA [Planctomycetota bacterium]HPY75510.1 preprotein translocase subunit SecA [Planctomycetota bacterium]HQB01123.1 preprotein translocase subunit SecA [Planctomycetota bacterium]
MLDRINEWLSKFLVKIFGSRNERLIKEMLPIVQKINDLESSIKPLSDEELKGKTAEFQKRYQAGETLDSLLPEAFAVVREAAFRTIGLRHFDVQMIGGIVLHQGKIAEMTTGEGKTLVATSPAYLNALTGKGVHIITVNDYLAKRDREWMGPIFERLGLTVGCIQADMDPQERIKQYRCNITYGTNNEFGFDYLRDNMKTTKEDQCQHHLYYAIVDEVDSVLIDEARTPLIISGPAEQSTDKYYQANKIAARLKKDIHFELKEKEQQAILTDAGIDEAERLAGVDSFYKGKNMDWPHHLTQALRAHHFFKLDREYLIQDNAVIIVDEFTGRPQPGRRWSDGLHQAIEAKEGLKIREENQTLATITFQNFFRLYEKLAGMTGTAMTEAMEFDKIYKLDVVAIPTNRPLQRKVLDDVIYGTALEKFKAIVEEIYRFHRIGQPLLVGTISIATSEYLSELLERRGIPHQVLNAKHHEKEAQIIKAAGELGRVTIATNMAGRGTDIVLGKFKKQDLLEHWQHYGLAPKNISVNDKNLDEKLIRHWAKVFLHIQDNEIPVETLQENLNQYWQEHDMTPMHMCETVAELGGLYVLGSERHDSRRIDNQLRGRSGRQGDPGCSRFYLSFDDDLLRKFAPPAMVSLMKRMGMQGGQDIRHPMINRGIGKAQQRVEEYHFEIRKNLLEYDEVMDEQRKIVYDQRQQVLENIGIRDLIRDMIYDRLDDSLDEYMPERHSRRDWDIEGFCNWFQYKFNKKIKPETIKEKAINYSELRNYLSDILEKIYLEKEQAMGKELMVALERYLLLDTIDSIWKDHLYAMDELKSSIGLSSFAQKDPKVEYKRSGYRMFDQMIDSVKETITNLIFKMQFEESDMRHLSNIWRVANYTHQDFQNQPVISTSVDRSEWDMAQQAASQPSSQQTIVRDQPKVGRNDPCPCGSGKKYKKCCG